MHKLFFILFLLLATLGVDAQYYYKDILSNRQLSADMATYKEKKIRSIKLKSFEADGAASEGFLCEKTISRDFKTAELFTRSNISAISLFTSVFNDYGQLLYSSDSSELSVTHNFYAYDKSGKIIKITSSVKSNDDDFTTEILEEHIYEYNDKGLPLRMMRVKNKRDSTRILFLADDKNNISIEKDLKTGRKYYYYYDFNNRLTDIAHTNEYREKLVADYIFEYDEAGLLEQMTVTEEGRGLEKEDSAASFVIWRYINENGLRTKEGLFSQNGKLMGSIEYQYR